MRGLAVGAKLPEVFVLSTVTITLHDILVSTITRVLVAHKCSRLDPERANFIVAPAHGLEGGIVVAKLTLTAKEVLTLIDSHTALSVVSTGNRSEGGHSLNVICIASSKSITLRILSPLQHKLLSLV